MDQELEEWKKEYENCGAIILEIHKLEDNEPDNRTKSYQIWKDQINFLFLQYNKLANFKAFKTI